MDGRDDDTEYVYNRVLASKIAEAEHYVRVYNSLKWTDANKTREMLKGYMLELIPKLTSRDFELEGFRLAPEYFQRREKVVKDISDILSE